MPFSEAQPSPQQRSTLTARPILIGGKPVTKEDLAKGNVQGSIAVGKEQLIQNGELAVMVGGSVRNALRATMNISIIGIPLVTTKDGHMAPAGYSLKEDREDRRLKIIRTASTDED